MPRLEIDENLPREVAGLLAAHGHDALTVHEHGHAGTSDADLSVVTSMLPLLSVEPLKEQLWIVEPDRVRIWRCWE